MSKRFVCFVAGAVGGSLVAFLYPLVILAAWKLNPEHPNPWHRDVQLSQIVLALVL
jgi:hypothetical protein